MVAASEPFRFLVGPHRREFIIHSAVVASQSHYLKRLVYGDFKEGNEKSVKWEDVDEDTFVRFWQYAYTGDYDIPQATAGEEGKGGNEMRSSKSARESRDTAMGDAAFEGNLDKYVPAYTSVMKKWRKLQRQTVERKLAEEMYIGDMPSKRQDLWEEFIALRLTSGRQVELNPKQESQGDELDASYLLWHARVYVFADCYCVVELMKLSYEKLRQSLCMLGLLTKTLPDLIALLHYCYETPAPADLKELVVLYTACNFERLWDDEQFQHISEAHADLSKDVMSSFASPS